MAKSGELKCSDKKHEPQNKTTKRKSVASSDERTFEDKCAKWESQSRGSFFKNVSTVPYVTRSMLSQGLKRKFSHLFETE